MGSEVYRAGVVGAPCSGSVQPHRPQKRLANAESRVEGEEENSITAVLQLADPAGGIPYDFWTAAGDLGVMLVCGSAGRLL